MLYLPDEFPHESGLCYLNHAAVGPWPHRTAKAVAMFAEENMRRGAADYPTWLAVERRLRERLARLINAASPDDIALVKNTSEGLSIVSQGLDWQAGDQVVGVRGDFCSNEMPWEALSDHAVEYRAIDASMSEDPEGALIAALTERTRLLAVSTVHFATGYRFDMQRLAAACQERGILLCVDAIQSLGAVPFDLDQIAADFVTAGGHKWLLAPEGLGFFYCRPALRDQLQLHQFGWAMRAAPYEFESDGWQLAASARRFEAGTLNMTGIHALDASLSLFEEFTMDKVAQRLAKRIEHLEAGLREMPGIELVTPSQPERRAGILTFRCGDLNGADLHAKLMKQNVICAARAGGVRLAPHFYTPGEVIDQALEIISQIIQDNK